MEIIKELRVENSQLKNGNSDLEYRMSKMEGDISKLTSQIQQTNVSYHWSPIIAPQSKK